MEFTIKGKGTAVSGRHWLPMVVLIGVIIAPIKVQAAEESDSSEAPPLSGCILDGKQFSIERGLHQHGTGTEKLFPTVETFLPGQFTIDAGLRSRQSTQPVILAEPLTNIKSTVEPSTSEPESSRKLMDTGIEKARTLESSGKLAASINELKKLLRLNCAEPSDIGNIYMLSCYEKKHDLLQAERSSANAVASYKKCASIDENLADALIWHARMLHRSKRFDECLAVSEEARKNIQEYPNRYRDDTRVDILVALETHLGPAFYRAHSGDAKACLNRLLNAGFRLDDREKVRIYHKLGNCYEFDEEFEKAEENYALAIASYYRKGGVLSSTADERIDLAMDRVMTLVRLSRYSQAASEIELARKLLERFPQETKSSTALVDWTELYFYSSLGDWPTTRQVAIRSCAHWGTTKRDKWRLARLRTTIAFDEIIDGNLRDARENIAAALRLDPSYEHALWQRGIIDDLEGNSKLAGEEFQKATLMDLTYEIQQRKALSFKNYSQHNYFCVAACSNRVRFWPEEAMPLKIYIENEGSSKGFSCELREIIVGCINEWFMVLPHYFRYSLVTDPEEAQLRFYQVDGTWLRPGIVGLTYYKTKTEQDWSISPIESATVRIVKLDSDACRPSNYTKRARHIFLHEIGHALGISSESPNSGDIMFGNFIANKLSERDIATIQMLYSKNLAADVEKTIASMSEKVNPNAQLALGWIYQNGLGPQQDLKHARILYRKAAKQDLSNAGLYLGDMYVKYPELDVNSYALALRWFKNAAKLGSSQAKVEMAKLYAAGTGVEKDDKLAFALYKDSAANHNSEGQRCVGECYANGTGVAQDPAEAAHWFIHAAKQNDSIAQRKLGEIYSKGIGAEKNERESFFWYQLAAMQDDVPAQLCLADMYKTGTGTRIDAAKTKFWYEKAAASGDRAANEKLNQLQSERSVPDSSRRTISDLGGSALERIDCKSK